MAATPVELGKPEKLNWPKSVTAVRQSALRMSRSSCVPSESGPHHRAQFLEGQPVRAGRILVQLDDSRWGPCRGEQAKGKPNWRNEV